MFDLVEEVKGQQLVIRGCGSLTAVLSRLYTDVSTVSFPEVWQGYPPEAEDLIKTLLRGWKGGRFRANAGPSLRQAVFTERPDEVMIGHSGGKDATAAALKLIEQGFKVHAFHVRGINRAYPHELQSCGEICAKLGIPLIINDVKVHGKQDWTENPVKNQLILAMMVDTGLGFGIAHYAQGGLSCDTIDEQAFGSGYSDSREMFDAFEPLAKTVVPTYRYHHNLLKNDTDSFLSLYRLAPDIIPMLHSCMGPLRYKSNLRKRNEEKYGVTLMPNRCGSCYKCALEFLHMEILGAVKSNSGFREHCYEVLIKSLEKILGPGHYTVADAERHFIDLNLLNSPN